jgi:sorting nexin-8
MKQGSNLTSSEILEQLWHAQRHLASKGAKQKIRNIVFMGMGEPMDNYDAVVQAIHGANRIFDIAYRRVTVSTVGVVTRIRQLAVDCKGSDRAGVNLALSLHAPTQDVRVKIVPSSSAYTVQKLMDALDYYSSETNRGVMIEYIVIEGVNASIEQGRQLGQLLSGRHVWVNLIPYNPTEVGDEFEYKAPTADTCQAFRHEVIQYKDHEGKGLVCKVRWSSANGRDVDGACGQLALKNLKMAGDSSMDGGGSGGGSTNSSSSSSSSTNSSSGPSSTGGGTSIDIEDIDLAVGARVTPKGDAQPVGEAGASNGNRSRRRKAEDACAKDGKVAMVPATGAISRDLLLVLMAILGLALLLLGVWL